MGLVYWPTWMVDFDGFHVGKYINPMDAMGIDQNAGICQPQKVEFCQGIFPECPKHSRFWNLGITVPKWPEKLGLRILKKERFHQLKHSESVFPLDSEQFCFLLVVVFGAWRFLSWWSVAYWISWLLPSLNTRLLDWRRKWNWFPLQQAGLGSTGWFSWGEEGRGTRSILLWQKAILSLRLAVIQMGLMVSKGASRGGGSEGIYKPKWGHLEGEELDTYGSSLY